MSFENLYQELSYSFSNESLLKNALTHKSYSNESQKKESFRNNERLEFLGDAVLNLVISQILMTLFPEMPEGGLSKLRASLVSENALSKIASKINLGTYLYIGKGEEVTGGREKSSILSDAFEAVIAAIFLDSHEEQGIQPIYQSIEHLFKGSIPSNPNNVLVQDFKTELQEYVQRTYHTLASYELVGESGPDHQKEFEAIVLVHGEERGRGKGMSKKQAEQAAAQEALQKLKADPSQETLSS